jgi:hypothetical protein
MATPVIAGNALIARDYFANSWTSYCRTEYTYCKSFVPSGYLLKAIILHSGQNVSRYNELYHCIVISMTLYNMISTVIRVNHSMQKLPLIRCV